MDPVVTLKRPSVVDYSLCIFCQNHTAGLITSKASDHGLATVKHATSSRRKLRDSKNIDLINRLENVLDSAEAKTLVWHKMCYAHFTDKNKLERLQKTQVVDSKPEASCSRTGCSTNKLGLMHFLSNCYVEGSVDFSHDETNE